MLDFQHSAMRIRIHPLTQLFRRSQHTAKSRIDSLEDKELVDEWSVCEIMARTRIEASRGNTKLSLR